MRSRNSTLFHRHSARQPQNFRYDETEISILEEVEENIQHLSEKGSLLSFPTHSTVSLTALEGHHG